MARKKIALAYITNNVNRRACYNKRKKGLIKKVNELRVMCDVEACVIVGSPCDKEPEVWPSHEVAKALYSSLDELSDEDHAKKVVIHEDYIAHKIEKVDDKVTRFQRDNRRREIDYFVHKCMAGKVSAGEFNVTRMPDVNNFINQRKRDINSMLQGMCIQGDSTNCPGPSR